MSRQTGILYLVPAPLGEGGLAALSGEALAVLPDLRFFIVERVRTARRFIKSALPAANISEMRFYELDKHRPSNLPKGILEPLLQGEDMGLLSEAGCPGVADPGAVVVREAHARGIRVKPLSGPSSLLLALMASGLNGQNFAFHGYLPVKSDARRKKLRALEREAQASGQTQLFIETPYRNAALFEDILRSLSPQTMLCVALDLSLPSEEICTRSIAQWQKSPLNFTEKRPAVFLVGV